MLSEFLHIADPADESSLCNRREVFLGGIATLAALMLNGCDMAAAKKTDPRHPFAQLLADLVIPRTDTSGAADVNTGGFLLMAVDQRMGNMEPGQLARVRDSLDASAGGDFFKLARQRQAALLDALDTRAFEKRSKAGQLESDWMFLKAAILAGYYTSEVGASKELRYDPVPGTRDNITIGPDFRTFSNPGFGGSL